MQNRFLNALLCDLTANDSWNAAAGGFPAMQGNVAFLMKDVVLFAVSFYLLKQDAERASLSAESAKTT
jgi:uncharacterized membrane protein YkgB